jgi:hypothetical protein
MANTTVKKIKHAKLERKATQSIIKSLAPALKVLATK